MEENTRAQRNLPRRVHQKGVTGGAVKKKQKLSEKLVDWLLGDEMMVIPDRLRDEFLIPRLEDLGYDLLLAAIGMAFGREPRGGRRRPGGYRDRDRDRYEEDYSRYSDRPSSSSRRSRRPSYEYHEVEFREREGAQEAMYYIQDYCDQYEQCPVAVLYEKAGLSAVPTDWSFGWKDLSFLTEDDIERGEDGGWVINLPNIERVRVR